MPPPSIQRTKSSLGAGLAAFGVKTEAVGPGVSEAGLAGGRFAIGAVPERCAVSPYGACPYLLTPGGGGPSGPPGLGALPPSPGVVILANFGQTCACTPQPAPPPGVEPSFKKKNSLEGVGHFPLWKKIFTPSDFQASQTSTPPPPGAKKHL